MSRAINLECFETIAKRYTQIFHHNSHEKIFEFPASWMLDVHKAANSNSAEQSLCFQFEVVSRKSRHGGRQKGTLTLVIKNRGFAGFSRMRFVPDSSQIRHRTRFRPKIVQKKKGQ